MDYTLFAVCHHGDNNNTQIQLGKQQWGKAKHFHINYAYTVYINTCDAKNVSLAILNWISFTWNKTCQTEASVKFSSHVKGYTPGLPSVDTLHTVCMNCVGIILLTYPSTLANLILSNSAPVPPWLLHSVTLKRLSLVTGNAIFGFPLILKITNINISREKKRLMRSLTFLLSHFSTCVCVHIHLGFSFFLILVCCSGLYCSGLCWNGVDLVSAVLVSVGPDWG